MKFPMIPPSDNNAPAHDDSLVPNTPDSNGVSVDLSVGNAIGYQPLISTHYL